MASFFYRSFGQLSLLAVLFLGITTASVTLNAAAFKVGIVLDKGGKDDKSFNAAAYRGSKDAEKTLGVVTKVLEGRDDNSAEPMLRSLAEKKFDLIIAVGFSQSAAVAKVAKQFPERKFVLIDSVVDAPNVTSVVFDEHQGAFVVGAIAAWTSKSKKIGFIGGMDIPLIRRFQMGYEAGAKYADPKVKVISNFAGVTGEAWNNPPKGKELALAQYAQGADVIFAAAGATGSGVFDAAEEKKKFAIGVDSNQNGIKPGLILTSMLKRVDVSVVDVVKQAQAGSLKGGTLNLGFQGGNVDYAVDEYNKTILPEAMRKKADQLKAQIMQGKIAVPDYYKNGGKT